ncbi:MAG: hypothetical protein IJZ76_00730, partial [Lachnospiraceae bacterium]|nr:hypothetical protein [Lachnospiraceae bacterium]
MKKQILMVLLMLFTMSSVDVCAQSFLKKIGKAVEKEVKNKVEKEIDKRVKKPAKQQSQAGEGNTQSATKSS